MVQREVEQETVQVEEDIMEDVLLLITLPQVILGLVVLGILAE
jgi:hypothetical protein